MEKQGWAKLMKASLISESSKARVGLSKLRVSSSARRRAPAPRRIR
jgi:hypothetical protein